MKRKQILVGLVGLCLAIMPLVKSAMAQEAAEAKTISRIYEHIVIKGERLSACLGKDINKLMLYAFKDRAMAPIPYQIDEITEDDYWVLPNASPYKEDREKGADELHQDDPPEVLDQNDELVFMINDAGPKAPESAYPEGWLAGVEIELTDPNDGGKGWVYLYHMPQPVKPSPVDYVDYDLKQGYKKDLVRASNYDLGFNPEVPITYAMIDMQDEEGKVDNLVDRMKIRIYSKLLRIFKIERNEEDMKSRLWQYKDGPVRIIRMVRSSIRLIAKLQSPEVASYSLYYKNAVFLPFRVNIPFDAKLVTNDTRFSGGVDMRSRYGWKVRLNTDERWVNVDGKMDELEKNLKTKGARWVAIKGKDGAFLLYIQGLDQYGIGCNFNYIDDDQTPAPPEFEVGQVPFVAFNAYGLENLKKGVIQFNVLVFIINRDLTEPETVEMAEQFDVPVRIEAAPLERKLNAAETEG